MGANHKHDEHKESTKMLSEYKEDLKRQGAPEIKEREDTISLMMKSLNLRCNN